MNTTNNTIQPTNDIGVTTTICSMQLIQGADVVMHKNFGSMGIPAEWQQWGRDTYRQFVGLWVQEDIKCEVTVWDETRNGRTRRLYSVGILPTPNQLEYLNSLMVGGRS